MNLQDFMTYAVQLTGNDKEGYVARLKGIPGALTGGDTREEAMRMAASLVTDWAIGCFADGEEMPAGQKPGPGEDAVTISADAAAKIMVRNEMLRKGVSLSSVAGRLGMPASQLSRNLRLSTSTRLSLLERICKAMGACLDVQLA